MHRCTGAYHIICSICAQVNSCLVHDFEGADLRCTGSSVHMLRRTACRDTQFPGMQFAGALTMLNCWSGARSSRPWAQRQPLLLLLLLLSLQLL